MFSRLIVFVFLMSFAQAVQASLLTISPFSGTYTETWETFPTTSVTETFLPDPTVIMQGAAIISNPHMATYQTDFNGCSLGDSGYSLASDGVKGMCLVGFSETATIIFNTPVVDFGAYWGAATSPSLGNPALISISFFDSDNQLLSTELVNYSRPNDGVLEWHGWNSTIPIKRITYSEDHVTIDGLQANPVPEPTTLGLLCIGGMFSALRRR